MPKAELPIPRDHLDHRLEPVRPGSRERHRQPDESAQEKHSRRRADAEDQEVDERADRDGIAPRTRSGSAALPASP
jgi:hypothetical protein